MYWKNRNKSSNEKQWKLLVAIIIDWHSLFTELLRLNIKLSVPLFLLSPWAGRRSLCLSETSCRFQSCWPSGVSVVVSLTSCVCSGHMHGLHFLRQKRCIVGQGPPVGGGVTSSPAAVMTSTRLNPPLSLFCLLERNLGCKGQTWGVHFAISGDLLMGNCHVLCVPSCEQRMLRKW